MVDYALRRRFAFIDLKPGYKLLAFREHLTSRSASSALVEKKRD
jgi:5-methylcytosine-specific restriction enzyme B